jgi:hypothetical protein
VGHDREVVSANVGQNAGVVPGLVAATRAPAAALVPALAGVRTLPATGLAGAALSACSLAVALALTLRAARRADERPALLGGLALIAGGYALTFCARAGVPGRALLETQRYHLFPLLGLVLLLAPALRLASGRFRDPVVGCWAAAALAAVLLVSHHAEMRGRARFLRFPDQAATLAALDRVGDLCADVGVTRAQVLAAFPSVEAAWAPGGRSVLVMLGRCAAASRLPDPLVRPTLLAALSAPERRALCGGMDATPSLRPAAPSAETVAAGRAVGRFRVRDESGTPVSAGWPSFVEFVMVDPSPPDAHALTLTARTGGQLEVWWRAEDGRWSSSRSVRLRPPGPGSWSLPLAALPHCDLAEVRRVRVLYHDPGPVALDGPRLVR